MFFHRSDVAAKPVWNSVKKYQHVCVNVRALDDVRSKPSCLFKNWQLCLELLAMGVKWDEGTAQSCLVWKPGTARQTWRLDWNTVEHPSIATPPPWRINTLIRALRSLPVWVTHLSVSFRLQWSERAELVTAEEVSTWFWIHWSDRGVWWHHEWARTSRDPDHRPERHALGGGGRRALLLHLPPGWLHAAGRPWQVLTGSTNHHQPTGLWHVRLDSYSVSLSQPPISTRLVLLHARGVQTGFYPIIIPDVCWHAALPEPVSGAVDLVIFYSLCGISLRRVEFQDLS